MLRFSWLWRRRKQTLFIDARELSTLIDRVHREQPRSPRNHQTGGQSMSTATDTSAMEREINQQVYALYRLKPEEIAVVEGGGK